MESKYVGIIIQRQDGKILLENDNYYIKVDICNNEDIYKLIADTLEKLIEIKIFKIKKVYEEIKKYENITPFQLINDIEKMYLVEVCIYNEAYEFLSKEEVYEKLYNCPQKYFYEKYILRYDIYKNFIQCQFTSLLMILSTLIIVGDIAVPQNQIIKIIIFLLLFGVVVFYILAIPKLTMYILECVINDNMLKYSNISSLTIGVLSLLIVFANK